jgi:hypothetical protein
MRLRLRKRSHSLAPLVITGAGGLVVLVAVGALLETLRRSVADVETSVEHLWETGKRLAQNTQAVHLLRQTEQLSTELTNELAEPAAKEGLHP